MLEAPADTAPSSGEAFLVLDAALRVQAVSRHAERMLGIREDTACNRPLSELLAPADAEAGSVTELWEAVAEAAGGDGVRRRVHVRPTNTFGVRLRARIGPCGPPRAAVIVVDGPQPLSST